jgi:sugar lactone lactonase YvrE
LRDLEHRFPRELAVVGVHSGKYRRERETERIREAAIRLGNAHPIVNDRQFRIWRAYAVSAWPTIVILSPTARVLGVQAGEFTAEALAPVIEQLVERYERSGELERRATELVPDAPAVAPGRLRYPGKVAVRDDRIAIADSGHHCVLVGRLSADGASARIERVVGCSGEPGFDDGADARFSSPQGLCFDKDVLYVADAGNHAVRAVDLATGAARTLAGTGRQLRTRDDLAAGAMSSPWDVALLGDTLFVAMAGVHQLWAVDLATGASRVHSGSGREEIADGPHRDAALAQPMGIAAAADGSRLYFADAESSAVRWADAAPRGAVGTIVGTGLFDFGDKDGAGDAVLMQHQQGLALHADGRLLVADSYNDALKWVDPATRRSETWVRGLHEPGGVACGERYAYVADTNAHRVVGVEYGRGEIAELEMVGG